MKSLNLIFENAEFEKIKELKKKIGKIKWENFIIKLAKNWEIHGEIFDETGKLSIMGRLEDGQ